MAHFAELNGENKTIRVLVVHNNELDDNGVESEAKGILFLKNLFGQNTTWKQTSYNTFEGVHKLGGTPFRKNYAARGMTYDAAKDAFIPSQPFPSWTLDETTCDWEAPVAKPDDGKMYQWNEVAYQANNTQGWEELTS